MVLKRDRMLRYHQLEVLTASDGAEGLALFRQHGPLLVITDLLMPKLDGFPADRGAPPRGRRGLGDHRDLRHRPRPRGAA
jgi:CheY-like chemotaxis protein